MPAACKTHCMQRSGSRGLAWVVAIIAFGAMVAVLVTHKNISGTGVYINSGGTVSPKSGDNVVFVNASEPQVQCTATTSDGQSVPLEPFTGEYDGKRAGGKRRILVSRGTDYRAVGVLPTDRGPLTVRCPGYHKTIWVTSANDGKWSLPVIVLFVISGSCLVFFVVVTLRRRRQLGPATGPGTWPGQNAPYQGYPQPSYNPYYPSQSYPTYPPPAAQSYPPPGYPPYPPPNDPYRR